MNKWKKVQRDDKNDERMGEHDLWGEAQEHAIYSLPGGIELPGTPEETWAEEEEELFKVMMGCLTGGNDLKLKRE